MTLVLIGVVPGLAGAYAGTRVMSGLFYGVSATEPLTFIGVSLLLAGIALIACLIPVGSSGADGPADRAPKIAPVKSRRLSLSAGS